MADTGSGKNIVTYSAGKKRSGKSHVVEQIAQRLPRKLYYDFVGEYRNDGNAIVARTPGQTVDALRAARRSGSAWSVIAIILPEQVPEVVEVIFPIGSIPEETFAYRVGGMAQVCGECDLVLPSNGGEQVMLDSISKGRHYGLSTLFATQWPRATHKILRLNADVVFAFKQQEPDDADYMAKLISRPDLKSAIGKLQPREYIRYFEANGLVERVAEDGRAEVIPEPD